MAVRQMDGLTKVFSSTDSPDQRSILAAQADRIAAAARSDIPDADDRRHVENRYRNFCVALGARGFAPDRNGAGDGDSRTLGAGRWKSSGWTEVLRDNPSIFRSRDAGPASLNISDDADATAAAAKDSVLDAVGMLPYRCGTHGRPSLRLLWHALAQNFGAIRRPSQTANALTGEFAA